ncbi:hypothetical protein HK103_001667 [Boothiomyces macroporosus]|uniref:Uncharacterized protein n=1 Tax=Boothiomyces macroporosus TaxID=261099 RepID=A0AAD5UA92_9FUNG|nr:hypothetical protein HK103_001667 [Boothiomyces macroporosus]
MDVQTNKADNLKVSLPKISRNSTGLGPRTSTKSVKSTPDRLSKTESRITRRTTVSSNHRPQLQPTVLSTIAQDTDNPSSETKIEERKSAVEIFPIDFFDPVGESKSRKQNDNATTESILESGKNGNMCQIFDENLFIGVDAPKIRPMEDSSESEEETEIYVPPIVELEELPLDYEPSEQFNSLNNYHDLIASVRLNSISRLEYYEIDEELEDAFHSALELNRSIYYVKLGCISDMFWSTLPKMTNLLHLQLENLDLKETVLLIDFLDNYRHIVALSVSFSDECPFLWKLVKILYNLPNLLYLEIMGYMCPKTSKELGCLLVQARNLVFLGVEFPEEECQIEHITEALKRNTNLRHLDFLDSKLKLTDCKLIADGIKFNNLLESLSLSNYNNFEEAMKFNTTLILPDDIPLSNELQALSLRNMALHEKFTQQATELLQISRILPLLDLLPEIRVKIFNLFVYSPIAYRDSEILSNVLLDVKYLGRMKTPFKFSNIELVRRCYYVSEVDPKHEYNHSLIEMHKNLKDGPEWLKQFTFQNYTPTPGEF